MVDRTYRATPPPRRPQPIPSDHGIAVDSNDAVRMLQLEVRLGDDVDVVAGQISGQVINGLRFRQSSSIKNVQRRRREGVDHLCVFQSSSTNRAQDAMPNRNGSPSRSVSDDVSV